MSTAIDTFAEQRRAWIAGHAGILLFQKRRAELLGKRIRARDRARIGARPDPHDDDVTPPLVFRQTSTATGGFETALVAVCAITAPIGWPVGRLLYGWITTLIPERLLGYPIPALLGTAVVCGIPLPLLYDPAPSVWSVIVVPWLFAQIPASSSPLGSTASRGLACRRRVLPLVAVDTGGRRTRRRILSRRPRRVHAHTAGPTLGHS